ncbi:major intrinsically disordered NOTCH2-binding receptor 1-like homolog isoform 2-T2 [Menidia menidia]
MSSSGQPAPVRDPQVWMDPSGLDLSALPNSDHPARLLQLDVGGLGAGPGFLQVGALLSTRRHWQNRLYSQRELRLDPRQEAPPHPEAFVDRYLEKHITPVTLHSNIRRNPLYSDPRTAADSERVRPSWTLKDYDAHTVYSHLAGHLKADEKTPKDLDFWLEDLYTPGFDSLLKRKEAEHRRKRLCKIFSLSLLLLCVLVLVIVVPVLLLQK